MGQSIHWRERKIFLHLRVAFRILPALPHGDTLHHQPSAPDALGCVIHSFIHPQCRSSKRSLIEYCSLGIPIVIGENSILSNITLLTSSNLDGSVLQLPSNLILQTIPLSEERFATFAFGFHDNMKATYEHFEQMKYFGQSLSSLATRLHLDLSDLFDDDRHRSLWTLKVFPVMNNANESFESTLKVISSESNLPSAQVYISIQEILQQRHISSLIQYRSNLINCT